jgi:hypothetical protein
MLTATTIKLEFVLETKNGRPIQLSSPGVVTTDIPDNAVVHQATVYLNALGESLMTILWSPKSK